MEEFRGEPEQVERLREELQMLHTVNHIKSGALEGYLRKVAGRLKIDPMTRQDIDKFRTGAVNRPRGPNKLVPLWHVVFSDEFLLPTAKRTTLNDAVPKDNKLNGEDGLFHSSIEFFHVHQHRNERAKTDIVGRFCFYHFSENFHRFSAKIQKAVVIGQWDISSKDGVFLVSEKQSYDGRIGKRSMVDYYSGYCIPKGINIIFMMKESKKETPKFYILEPIYDNPETLQTEIVAGYMLKGSYLHGFFHSPVYAVRVPDDQDVECNILPNTDISDNIIDELNKILDR